MEPTKEVSKEVLSQLEKEVVEAGTFYMVWQTRNPDVENIDVFISNSVKKEELLSMVKYLLDAYSKYQN